MTDLNLRAKLGLGFGIILVILAGLGVFSYLTIKKLNDAFAQVQERDTKLERTVHLERALERQSAAVAGYLLTGKEKQLAEDEEGQREFREALIFFQNTVRTEEGKRLMGEITRRYDIYRAHLEREIQAQRARRGKDVAASSSSATSTIRKELQEAFRNFDAYQRKRRDEGNSEEQGVVALAKLLTGAISASGFVVGAIVAWWFSRSLSRGVRGVSSALDQIADNNLGIPDLKVISRDEVGSAAQALNAMKNSLRQMIESMAKTAEHLASASEELSASAAQQAQGSETQKDQAVQIATAMQEMVATVGQVSENSSHAAEASRQAAETAQKGGTIVEDALAKMRSIAESVRHTAAKMSELGKASDQIGHIVGVIDDIADQTNLLALNAAIEAARAGEQGRGFAVVADEVRKLAERTTGATKEIAQMIKNIQGETRLAVTAMDAGTKEVEDGVKSTMQAGESLKEIIRMAEQVGEMVTSIATAATEQSSASDQINQNMDQIARLARESAVGSQESAKACQELSNLALDMQKMVSKFQLGDGQARVSRDPNGVAGADRAFAAVAH